MTIVSLVPQNKNDFAKIISFSKIRTSMNQFRIHHRHNRILIVFMIIMALLFIQTLPLHVHSPHDHHKQLDQMGMLDKHERHSEIHVGSSDLNNEEEHGPATEIDLSADAVGGGLGGGGAGGAV